MCLHESCFNAPCATRTSYQDACCHSDIHSKSPGLIHQNSKLHQTAFSDQWINFESVNSYKSTDDSTRLSLAPFKAFQLFVLVYRFQHLVSSSFQQLAEKKQTVPAQSQVADEVRDWLVEQSGSLAAEEL